MSFNFLLPSEPGCQVEYYYLPPEPRLRLNIFLRFHWSASKCVAGLFPPEPIYEAESFLIFDRSAGILTGRNDQMYGRKYLAVIRAQV